MTNYDTLNAPQKEAVFHMDGPLLILAGAGSGKTRVLTHRIAWLIEEKGVSPWNIMAITFTNKAAGEMKERVDKMLEYAAGGVWVSTFHSTCVRILRRYIDRIGYNNSFTIYDTDDQKTLMKDILKQLNVDTKQYKERYFMSLISSAKDELIGPAEYALKVQNDFRLKKVAEVYAEYQRQLKNNNALDFDDLICKTVDLFETCPDVLEYYQEKFRYIMIDEYQDTNTAQFKLVNLLASKYKNLCVVGDDDQSIYKFRGANIANILNFEKYFPEAKVIRLEQNYRSTQNILNTANEVICHNVGRKQKRLWTENPVGEKIQFKQLMTSFDEAEYVSDRIKQGVYDGKWSYGDCAILYRTNAQSRMFEEKFLLANIPYKIVGGVNFYARKEIKDILAYLKTVANASDDIAVKRIINVPKRGIGATTIAKVQDYALYYDMSFFDALENADLIPGLGRSASKLQGFVKTIQTFRSKAEFFNVKEIIEDVIETTGYVDELRAEGTDEANDRIENIDELLNKAATYDEEESEEHSLDAFLEEVALVADIDSLEEDPDHVLMMTIHSAKGLEFPNVFMVGMEDGIFPSYMSIMGEDNSEIEEERRLCYVGITRSKEKLFMTAAKQRMTRGEMHYNKVSRFIEDIPEDYLMGESRKKTYASDTASRTGYSSGTGGTGYGTGKSNIYGQGSAYGQNNPYTRKSPYARTNPYATAEKVPKDKPLSETGVFDLEQFKVKKVSGLDYTTGDRVRHIKFGEGTVKNIAEGGRDYEVTVEFDRVGVKKMFASFAKLVKV